jgi:uncharacterized RDD family membrane protein YckC
MPVTATRRLSRGIVTPEAVLLDFEVAGLASRLLSRVIDLLVLLGGFWLLSLVTAILPSLIGETATVVVLLVVSAAMFFAYPIVLEVRWQGRTVGKRALGLHVLTNEGGPVRMRHAVVRSMFQTVDLFFGIGLISGILTPRTQRLGDLAAGTFVVRKPKGVTTGSGPVFFPPPRGYETYVSSLDVAAVTTSQYELIRAYLLRIGDFSASARQALAIRLAGPMARQLGVAIPANVGPELFVACVAAAYQQRNGRALPRFGWFGPPSPGYAISALPPPAGGAPPPPPPPPPRR